MKNCRKYKNNISAYIDNELDKNQKHDFENHIKNCAKCQSEYSKILLISDSLSENTIEAPQGFMASLKGRIATEEVNKKKSFYKYFNFKTCSAVFAICLLAISFKTPLYDNLNKVENDRGFVESGSVEKKELPDAKFVEAPKDDVKQLEKNSVVTKNNIERTSNGSTNIETPTYSNDSNANTIVEGVVLEPIQMQDSKKYFAANEVEVATAELKTPPANDDTVQSEEILLDESSVADSNSKSNDETNMVKVTVLKDENTVKIIEKYFGETTCAKLSYETYISFKGEIEQFTDAIEETIVDETKEVNIEIFLI
ncbi:MAG: zf-HC2 domain-containing protein [Ruminococcaceae bacterium]|nr:zf-HC2 domain-containing protein [Oscillospiraceae bacterium]